MKPSIPAKMLPGRDFDVYIETDVHPLSRLSVSLLLLLLLLLSPLCLFLGSLQPPALLPLLLEPLALLPLGFSLRLSFRLPREPLLLLLREGKEQEPK